MSADARTTAQKWVEGWGSPDPSSWISLYAPHAKYTDHAFQIVRIGPETLTRHWNIWRTSHPDFTMEVLSWWPEEKLPDGRVRISFRTNNTGTFMKDLPTKKASGAPFAFVGVVDLLINVQEGVIDEVEEWYGFNFERVKSVADYNTRADDDSGS